MTILLPSFFLSFVQENFSDAFPAEGTVHTDVVQVTHATRHTALFKDVTKAD